MELSSPRTKIFLIFTHVLVFAFGVAIAFGIALYMIMTILQADMIYPALSGFLA